MVLILVIVALLPQPWMESGITAIEAARLQKNLAAFTFLFAFTQVRVLLLYIKFIKEYQEAKEIYSYM
jgi:hypothetical protein